MTKSLTLLVSLFVTLTIFGQSFEGQIVYQNTFKSKSGKFTDQQWTSKIGSTQNYFIKEGNYRSNTNGSMVQWQLYINSDNRLYNKISGSETIYWNEGSVNADEVLSSEVTQIEVEILGYKCNELILTCKSGIQKYYYAPDLVLESSLFEKHKYGNFSEYATRAKSLPLKIIVDNAQFTMESLAIEVRPVTLEQSLFMLPKNAKTAKSPY